MLNTLPMPADPNYVVHILHVQAHEASALPGSAGAAAFACETDEALHAEKVTVNVMHVGCV